jgi:hypothetical protein
MNVTTLGRVNVATPGTPVPLTTDATLRACKIFFQVIPGLTGKGYIGRSGLNRTTLSGVVRVLWPNTSGGLSDSFFLELGQDSDVLNLASYYIDMDVAAEGLLVSYWTQ